MNQNIEHKQGYCRSCGGMLYAEPALYYSNMPRSAQHLPMPGDDCSGTDLRIMECSRCGLLQLDCEPVPYYREVIRACGLSETMTEFRRKQFADFLAEFNLKGKKFLEAGCGSGEYLRIMRDAGTDAFGTEYSADSVDNCRKTGLNVLQMFPSGGGKIPGGPFDAFGLFNSFEHFPSPSDFLGTIRANLVENAVGIIEVPDFEGSIRDSVFFTFIPDHLFYFTRETLKRTIEMNGFDVLRIDSVWHGNILSATVKRREKFHAAGFISAEGNFRRKAMKFINGTETAFWGAGHEALFLLSSLCDTGKDIKYVIDSAPFKQGRLTPATGIPIVPPDILEKDPPQSIIIAAGSYTGEIAEQIQKKYGRRFRLAVVKDNTLEELQ